MFELHPQLAQDCIAVGDLPLCRVLLLNDANYPWVLLVPRREGISELFQLAPGDQQQLVVESSAVSEALARHFQADKINIAALGNRVPQLHVHHIVRYHDDPAWPAPVWGAVSARSYSDARRADMLHQLRDLLQSAGLQACADD